MFIAYVPTHHMSIGNMSVIFVPHTYCSAFMNISFIELNCEAAH